MKFDKSLKITNIKVDRKNITRLNFKYNGEQFSVQPNDYEDKLVLRKLVDSRYSVIEKVDLQSSLTVDDIFPENGKMQYGQMDTEEIATYLNDHFSDDGQYVAAKNELKDHLKYKVIDNLKNLTMKDSYYTRSLSEDDQKKIAEVCSEAADMLKALVNSL